jgi:acetate kinase
MTWRDCYVKRKPLNRSNPGEFEIPAESNAKTVVLPGPERSRILTINGGSSSLKFALFEQTDPSVRVLSGRVDRIGLEDARWVAAYPGGGGEEDRRVDAPDQKAAVRLLIDWLERAVGLTAIVAVGHRVVHGGSRYH